VVQEFKCCGLKKLFEVVTSIAYKKLITQFYENLFCDYIRLGVLFSSIQDKNIEVTSSDIAAALKCNDVHPQVTHSWMSNYCLSTFQKSLKICVRGSMQMVTIMLATDPSCLHNSSL
jgi:hypothetical protein